MSPNRQARVEDGRDTRSGCQFLDDTEWVFDLNNYCYADFLKYNLE